MNGRGLQEKFSTVSGMVLLSKSEIWTQGVKKCATELCIERFVPSKAYAKTLGCIAHRTDFLDSAKFPLPPLTCLISYYLGKKELNHKLSSVILDNVVRGIIWNIEMQEDMVEASRLIDDDSVARSIKSMIIIEFYFKPANATEKERAMRVAIVKADSFVSRSILLGKIIDDTEIDLAIAYTQEGKLSLRGKDRSPENLLQIDCSEIAATFREGGGHPGAAGGFLKTNVDKNGDSAVLVEIESNLQNYFEKLEQ